jgi:hypothetical protein
MMRTSRRRGSGFLVAFGVLASIVVGACVSDDPGVKVDCNAYCTVIAKACGGDNIQYRDTAECMKVCSLLPIGSATDGDTNSIACRLNKAQSAKTLSDCIAAGPFGGGVCGTRCAAYCTIAGKSCFSLPNPIFSGSEGTCNEACPSFHFDPNEGEGPKQDFWGENTLNCRSFHLILSTKSPDDAKTHCPHADIVSSVCVRPEN